MRTAAQQLSDRRSPLQSVLCGVVAILTLADVGTHQLSSEALAIPVGKDGGGKHNDKNERNIKTCHVHAKRPITYEKMQTTLERDNKKMARKCPCARSYQPLRAHWSLWLYIRDFMHSASTHCKDIPRYECKRARRAVTRRYQRCSDLKTSIDIMRTCVRACVANGTRLRKKRTVAGNPDNRCMPLPSTSSRYQFVVYIYSPVSWVPNTIFARERLQTLDTSRTNTGGFSQLG